MRLFIAFEGTEGCGKSTQAKYLYKKLIDLGEKVTLTHEPGGTELGMKVRHLLKWNKKIGISSETELFLFVASRAQLVHQVIKPALDKNEIVLCDRFAASTVAYQGYGRGINLNLINSINKLATGNLEPDLNILLDLPPEAGMKRKTKLAHDRFEKEAQEFHNRVRKGFLEIAALNSSRWLVIDAAQNRDKIKEIISNKVLGMLH